MTFGRLEINDNGISNVWKNIAELNIFWCNQQEKTYVVAGFEYMSHHHLNIIGITVETWASYCVVCLAF